MVKQASEINYGAADWREKDELLWNGILALDKEVGIGLVSGRHIKWGVADGYAHYFVVKVGKRLTELEHIPYGDNYAFAGTFVENGKIMVPTAVAQETLKWSDGLRELFSKKS